MQKHNDMIQSILQNNNGYITATQVTEAGVPRRCLSEMLASGELYKVGRGVYALPETWEDEMFFLQYRYGKGVFSHGTALYLHSMTDRTPHRYTMTFPYGYNPSRAKKQGITAKVATTELYELGIITLTSPCGNPLKVYDIERTLCDIVRGKNAADVQLVNQAMKMYAASKSKDISKIVNYSEKLRVKLAIYRFSPIRPIDSKVV